MPQPQVWPRRQEVQQQTPAESAPMERVERMNMIIVYPQQQQAVFVPRCNPYAIEVDHSRNCYSCRRFEYLARNCETREKIGI